MGIFTKAVQTLARAIGLTDPRLYEWYGGGRTHSGEAVSVNTALQLDAVWSCVRLISQTIATLPLFLYRRDGKGRGEVDSAHPLYRILHDQPNADMTATEFWEAIVAAILLQGNAYGWKDKIGRRVVAITPMRPDFVTVKRLQDGSLQYVYTWQGTTYHLGEDDVLHIKGFSLDGLMGLSPISQARQSLGTAIAAEKSAASFFRNGMQPSKIMEAPQYLTDAQRQQAKGIIERYTGAAATGSVPLLEGGWKISDVSLKPEDAQLLQTRAFHVEQICRWFDVPPIMIGHMDKSTAWGTGMEQMMLWFLTFSLRPHLKRIEQAISKSLLTPEEQLSHYAEFNVEGLLRADSKGRAELYGALAMNGLRTRNELRALDNEPPMPGGDDLTVQSNLIPIQLLGTDAHAKVAKAADSNAQPKSTGTERIDAST